MSGLSTQSGDYAATEFGSFRGNGNNDDGPGISSALLAISASGGGRYVFPPGVVVGIGTTILQPSQVELVIPTSCTLKALPGLVGPMIANLDQVNGNAGVRVSGGGVNNGARVSGNGLTLLATSTDNTGVVVATDTGPATQAYGIQEIAASGCDRNVFTGSCNANVLAPTSFIGAASQLFTQPSLLAATLTNPTITGAVQTADGEAAYAAHLLSVGDGTINRALAQYKIGEVVSAASQATISFPSIAAFYRHLRLEGYTENAGAAVLHLQFNGDGGAHYSYSFQLLGTGAFTVVAGDTAINFSPSQGINNFQAFTFDIPLYSVANANQLLSFHLSDSQNHAVAGGGVWTPTTPAAITSILLLLSAGNFVNGSTVTLYGVA